MFFPVRLLLSTRENDFGRGSPSLGQERRPILLFKNEGAARALVCSGVTRSEKAFVSQCAPEAPIGVTFRQKVLRYQRTAQSVLNRDLPKPTLSFRGENRGAARRANNTGEALARGVPLFVTGPAQSAGGHHNSGRSAAGSPLSGAQARERAGETLLGATGAEPGHPPSAARDRVPARQSRPAQSGGLVRLRRSWCGLGARNLRAGPRSIALCREAGKIFGPHSPARDRTAGLFPLAAACPGSQARDRANGRRQPRRPDHRR